MNIRVDHRRIIVDFLSRREGTLRSEASTKYLVIRRPFFWSLHDFPCKGLNLEAIRLSNATHGVALIS